MTGMYAAELFADILRIVRKFTTDFKYIHEMIRNNEKQ